MFYFHPYLGKIPNLTNIFQMGWNHQLVTATTRGYLIETLWNPMASNLNLTSWKTFFVDEKILQVIWSHQVQITVFQLYISQKHNGFTISIFLTIFPKKKYSLYITWTHQPLTFPTTPRKPDIFWWRDSVSRLQYSQLMQRPCCSRMHYKNRRIKCTGRPETGKGREGNGDVFFFRGQEVIYKQHKFQQHKRFTHSNQIYQ